ncbi:MAG: prenyltransferase/squalene oxidase repeat-containing protein [Microcystis sp.]|jgi:hypothetical protein|uniref:prenyltransferase/squalene oxidase repeat-containing protein n=3 Tax=Microcystis TaxID=1125 RepID=UPI0022BDB77C|nr:prenyltransferase/squalene oxidase repeat-containing protein [Microcystis sp. LE19-195.1E]MCZ8247987.1 hypothetical protein [Microcystis sp. LE19-195.1E]
MNLSLQECIENSSHWLEKIQNKIDGGWGQYKGADSNCLNTAEAIIALLETGMKDPGDQAIQLGAKYLIEHQLSANNCADREHYGAWARNVLKDPDKVLHIPDAVRTSLAVLALKLAGVSLHNSVITQGVEWLIHTQNADGGWGYTRNHESHLFPTCVTLKTILRICPLDNTSEHSLCRNSNLEKVILDAFKHIHTYRNNDGSFGKEPELLVPHTLHVIDVINMADKQENLIPKIYFRDIKPAIDWIDDNKKCVLQWTTETVSIGEGYNSQYNYTFSHINPSLYLRFVFPIILEKVGSNFNSENALARYALEATFDNIDNSSSNAQGFCAKRPVSWATSHTIVGLSKAKSTYINFPERELPSTKLNERHYLLIFLIVIIVLSTILSLINKLTGLQSTLFLLVILALLLIYGYISERSFIGLIQNKIQFNRRVSQ